MRKKSIFSILLIVLLISLITGCSGTDRETSETLPSQPNDTASIESDTTVAPNSTADNTGHEAPMLLYMGHASIRIVTPENKVIYIDPYAGDEEDYGLPADLILVTHSHFDHCAVEKVVNRNDDCRIITQAEAINGTEHITYNLDYVIVEPVQAGFNSLHDISNCVGYVLTFTNGKSVYVTGDTSKTDQMSEMAVINIDYAFYCCDGMYNMGLEEAAECAGLVGAKHNIPYHNTTSNTGDMFDMELAKQFNVPNRMIVVPGEEFRVE